MANSKNWKRRIYITLISLMVLGTTVVFCRTHVHKEVEKQLKENLKVGEYYEFTYHVKGKMDKLKELEMIDVVGMIVEEHPNNDNLTATLQIKKTDKLGLDQTQEPICKPST